MFSCDIHGSEVRLMGKGGLKNTLKCHPPVLGTETQGVPASSAEACYRKCSPSYPVSPVTSTACLILRFQHTRVIKNIHSVPRGLNDAHLVSTAKSSISVSWYYLQKQGQNAVLRIELPLPFSGRTWFVWKYTGNILGIGPRVLPKVQRFSFDIEAAVRMFFSLKDVRSDRFASVNWVTKVAGSRPNSRDLG